MDDRTLETLLGRADALAVLVDGPVDKPGLVDALDVSRSTVDRAIRDLEGYGLVERDGGRLRATLPGRLAHRAVVAYRDRSTAALRGADLLAHLPPDSPVDARPLADATYLRRESPAAYRPAARLSDLIDGATRVRGLVRALTDTGSARVLREAVLDGLEYQAVYTADVADVLRAEYDAGRHEMAATGRYRAFETDAIPFGLFLAYGSGGPTDDPTTAGGSAPGGGHGGGSDSDSDSGPTSASGAGTGPEAAVGTGSEGGTVTGSEGGPAPDADGAWIGSRSGTADRDARMGVAVYDREHTLRGAVFNDTPAAVAWAEETFRAYRRTATEFTDDFRSS